MSVVYIFCCAFENLKTRLFRKTAGLRVRYSFYGRQWYDLVCGLFNCAFSIYSISPGCNQTLGMENKAINNNQIQASYIFFEAYVAYEGRLNNQGGENSAGVWRPDPISK